jgi:small multidrug resistance pump
MWGAAFLLSLAIAVEVGATAVLPRAEGFTNVWWSVVTLVGYNAAILLLALVVKQMDVSLAYAIWAGAGTALIAVLGMLFLGEVMTAAKGAFIALIVVGVVGLNMVSTAHA